MAENVDYLSLDDAALLGQCDLHTYKSSGPGGQHRNKVSSAVRLHHRPSGVSAHGDDSRSQHENKRLALGRLRMNIALQIRRPVFPAGTGAPAELPEFVRECVFRPRGRGADASSRLEVGRKDFRFWRVAAFLLDVLDGYDGRVADAAAAIGITTGNLSDLLTGERHLLTAANAIRKAHGHKALT